MSDVYNFSATLNFSGNNVALNLVLRNAGQGELSLVELITTQKWLDITPLEVNEAGLGTYRVSVNRSDLPDGIYAADIIAQSTVNTLNVRALISVGGEATTADVGIIYILLYDTATGEVAGQFVSAGNNGEYGFDFADVPAGQYEVIAGSDADNDLLICDPGEACGTWLTLDQPIQIELEADTNNINFPIEYLVSLPSIAGEALPVPGTTAGQRPSTTGKTVAKTRLPTDDDSSPNPITRR